MHMSNRSNAFFCVILMCLCGCSERQEPSGSPNDAERESSFASPEIAFQTAKTAILSEDYAGFCDCWTADGRDLVAVGFVFTGGLYKHMAERENKTENLQRITEVFEKHGLMEGTRGTIRLTGDKDADRKEVLKLVEPINDRTGFIIDMLELIPIVSERPNPRLIQDNARLVDLSVTGDTASATLVQTREDKVLESPITFSRVNGEWKIAEIERLMN